MILEDHLTKKTFLIGNSGLIIVEEAAQLARAAYDADEKTNAIFSMIERKFDSFAIPITFIGGMRYEMYTLDLRPYNTVTGQTYVNPLQQPYTRLPNTCRY